ncbi:ATP-dependent DNA helicase [Caligus rogercresseyi]|uniref:ATP-dependent DNA helicase n=1 Tax=Caligus rogercresseyi TaxID=217165 RepID=A0A7T8H113_CALRO|nr:ATP-dependent DNA helicase [Caligus rogercresseyi]
MKFLESGDCPRGDYANGLEFPAGRPAGPFHLRSIILAFQLDISLYCNIGN